LLWVQNEMSFDMFHAKRDNLYQAGNKSILDGELHTWFSTPKPLAPALKNEFPEIANTSRYSQFGSMLMTVGNKKLTASGAFVDSAFLRMFSFPLLAGDARRALVRPTDIVITEALATRLFGKEEALGKTIRIDTLDVATVSGVLKDLPGNTRFRGVEYFMPWTYMEKLGASDDYWGNNSVQTYVELARNASPTSVNEKIRDITIRHSNGNEDNKVFLHALPDWWLRSKFENGQIVGGRIEMVRLFTIIAGFILLIACINFMNLSTARSEKRAKEVGIRKVAGAYRYSLI